MILEVLPYLIMVTCMLIRVSSKEVKWTMCDTPKLGQDLTLFCKVDKCTVNGTKIWHGGPDDKVLMVNNGISTDKAKYSTSIEKNGFFLTILNLTVEDLNVSYECSCGFYLDKHILYKEDVYKDLITDANTEEESTISTSEKEDLSTVDNLNKTTNGTNYVGTNVARGEILPIIIPIVLVIMLIIIIVVIKKCGLWERLKEKINGSRRRNPDDDNIRNVRNALLSTHSRNESNESQSSGSAYYSAEESLDPSTSREATIAQLDAAGFFDSGSTSPTVSPYINQRKMLDEDYKKHVRDPSLSYVDVESKQRRSLVSSTPPFHVGGIQIQCSGSSTRSVHVGVNQIQCSGSSTRSCPVGGNQIQCSGSSTRSVHVGVNQIQCSGSSTRSCPVGGNQIPCSDSTQPSLHIDVHGGQDSTVYISSVYIEWH